MKTAILAKEPRVTAQIAPGGAVTTGWPRAARTAPRTWPAGSAAAGAARGPRHPRRHRSTRYPARRRRPGAAGPQQDRPAPAATAGAAGAAGQPNAALSGASHAARTAAPAALAALAVRRRTNGGNAYSCAQCPSTVDGVESAFSDRERDTLDTVRQVGTYASEGRSGLAACSHLAKPRPSSASTAANTGSQPTRAASHHRLAGSVCSPRSGRHPAVSTVTAISAVRCQRNSVIANRLSEATTAQPVGRVMAVRSRPISLSPIPIWTAARAGTSSDGGARLDRSAPVTPTMLAG